MHGDHNTSYFHNAATSQKKRKSTKKLLDDTRVWKEGARLKNHVAGYFTNLFTIEDTGNNAGVLDAVSLCITEAMNETLKAPFTTEEVKKALFNIGDLKALGPDGLHVAFYK
jgi:hypothetical protein